MWNKIRCKLGFHKIAKRYSLNTGFCPFRNKDCNKCEHCIKYCKICRKNHQDIVAKRIFTAGVAVIVGVSLSFQYALAQKQKQMVYDRVETLCDNKRPFNLRNKFYVCVPLICNKED